MQEPNDEYERKRIRIVRTIGAGIMIATGLVWSAQGIGLPPSTPISGDPFWLVAGSLALAAGLYVGWLVYADTRRPS
ncbi:MAG TPA: hypothetical protein VJZ72_07190 [Candidatus Limnocylindrales bacterium]|nr:hypothetical protein [Candidatus Limnocylindrales bacterium]